jgi:hypothetical protein
MDLKRLSQRAKDLVDKRGGSDSLKQDAEELKRIAKGEGSLADKAKAAASAIKDPGAAGTEGPAAEAEPAERARAEEKVGGEARGKYKHAGEGRGRKGGGRRGHEGRSGDGDAL